MHYSTYRQEIQSGDLLAWTSTSKQWPMALAEKIIRLFTLSEYCHVGIAWVIGDRVFVIEAVNPKVRIYPVSNDLPCYHVPMFIPWTDALLSFLLEKVGSEYSVVQAIQAYFGKPRADKQWQCAELVNTFYQKAGVTLGDAWTPSEVVNAALEHTSANNFASIRLVERN